MRFSKRWLEEYVTGLANIDVNTLAERLTESLAEVEGIEDLATKFRGLVIGKVVDVKKHPNSDKLYITRVDIGDNVVQVVTGASNLRPGDFVPYTPVGVKVPVNPYGNEPLIISAKPLAGVMSEGMLNSEKELGIGYDHTKILVLNELNNARHLRPGLPLANALGFDDYMIEIENKALTHRGDVFGILGLVREIGTIFNLKVRYPNWWYGNDEQVSKTLQGANIKDINIAIKVDDKEAVLRYAALYMEGVQNRESPLWLKLLLSKYGITPRTYVVDVTNYLMLLLGQPIHAFDVDKLLNYVGRTKIDRLELGVRWSRNGDEFEALNNKKYNFEDSQALLITFFDKPVAIAGIIGGKDTGVTEQTKRVIFEIATFNNITIRKGMMRLGLFTDAGVFFSRKQDPNKVIYTAYSLLESVSHTGFAFADSYINKVTTKQIKLSTRWLNSFLGVKITYADIMRLSGLGVDVKGVDIGEDMVSRGNKQNNDATSTEAYREYNVIVPTWRFDLNIPEDIAEEIIRLKGYNTLPVKLPAMRLASADIMDKVFSTKEQITTYLVSQGFTEVVNYSFISSQDLKKVGINPNEYYHIRNAISEDVEYMRGFLGVSLLSNLQTNIQFWDSVDIFEIDKVFSKRFGLNKENVPNEYTDLAILSGLKEADRGIRVIHLYSIKRTVDNLLKQLVGKRNLKYIRLDSIYKNDLDLSVQPRSDFLDVLGLFRPTQGALVVLEGDIIGIFGQLRSNLKAGLGIGVDNSVILAEINLDLITQRMVQFHRRGKVISYPPIMQDLCFILDSQVTVSDIYQALLKALPSIRKQYAENIVLDIYTVDIYRTASESSVTFRVVFASKNRTLKEAELSKARQIFIDYVHRLTGAKLKGRQ